MTSLDTQLEKQKWKRQGDFWASPNECDDEVWVICRCGDLLATCYRDQLIDLVITCDHCGNVYSSPSPTPFTLPMF